MGNELEKIDFEKILKMFKKYGNEFQIDFTGSPIIIEDGIIKHQEPMIPFSIYKILSDLNFLSYEITDEGFIKVKLNEDLNGQN
jgi:hypothetical protein